jgi:HD-GYP domain-containing protein (c-di-GMP phosphodiesterase class II)
MRDLPQPVQLNAWTRALVAAMLEREQETGHHCRRTGAICDFIGRSCALDSGQRALLLAAATLHDIGKIGIPDRILCKHARFDAHDMAVMQQHPVIGFRILSGLDSDGAEEVAQAVLHHHEDFDGGGYPDGLAGEAIPLFARIIALADSYDALASARAYHAALRHAEIMAVMHGRNCGRYDPYLFATFERQMEHSEYRA